MGCGRFVNGLAFGATLVLLGGGCQAILGIEDVKGSDDAGTEDDAGVPPPTSSIAVNILGAPDALTNESTATFTFAANAPASKFECRLRVDGSAPEEFDECSSPYERDEIGEGEIDFDVRAFDIEGNNGPIASYGWAVDLTAPDTTITQSPGTPLLANQGIFAFEASEAGVSFECSVTGGAFESCTSPRTVTELGDGNNSFAVRAIDPAGNVDATPAQENFLVDTGGPPGTTITTVVGAFINTDAISISFTSTQPNSTFECKLDGGLFQACTSPRALTNLPEGARTFLVRATDEAQQTDPTPAEVSFTVDTIAPSTSLASAPGDFTPETNVSFNFSSEAGSTFECNLNGSGFAPCSDPVTFTVAGGANSLQYRATDLAGNVESAKTKNFTVGLKLRAFGTGGNTGNGNLGGRAGADDSCLGQLNGINGDYSLATAFLCIDETDNIRGLADVHGFNSEIPIYSNNGTMMAENWASFIGDPPLSSLQGAGITSNSGRFWSGCDADGITAQTANCNAWTDSSDEIVARGANQSSTNQGWFSGSGSSCNSFAVGTLCVMH